MKQYNMHDAKTHLSSLIKEAANGYPFVIATNGKPLVKVIPFVEEQHSPRVGFLNSGKLIPENFDELNKDEIEKMFG
jgi:prevent-host-death family protein